MKKVAERRDVFSLLEEPLDSEVEKRLRDMGLGWYFEARAKVKLALAKQQEK